MKMDKIRKLLRDNPTIQLIKDRSRTFYSQKHQNKTVHYSNLEGHRHEAHDYTSQAFKVSHNSLFYQLIAFRDLTWYQ